MLFQCIICSFVNTESLRGRIGKYLNYLYSATVGNVRADAAPARILSYPTSGRNDLSAAITQMLMRQTPLDFSVSSRCGQLLIHPVHSKVRVLYRNTAANMYEYIISSLTSASTLIVFEGQ